jgi:hypothetical protein
VRIENANGLSLYSLSRPLILAFQMPRMLSAILLPIREFKEMVKIREASPAKNQRGSLAYSSPEIREASRDERTGQADEVGKGPEVRSVFGEGGCPVEEGIENKECRSNDRSEIGEASFPDAVPNSILVLESQLRLVRCFIVAVWPPQVSSGPQGQQHSLQATQLAHRDALHS